MSARNGGLPLPPPTPRLPIGQASTAAGDAEKNLQKCRVRIQSIDVKGGKELGAALSKLGVRVVKGSADLTSHW